MVKVRGWLWLTLEMENGQMPPGLTSNILGFFKIIFLGISTFTQFDIEKVDRKMGKRGGITCSKVQACRSLAGIESGDVAVVWHAT